MKHIKDLKISDEELESKRVTEILEAMALRSGPEYAKKLKKLSAIFRVLLQAADVSEFCGTKPVSLLLDLLGVAMCEELPKIAGVSEADFLTVMRATEEDGEDLQKLLRKKLGI